jgi:hypothetical protein
MQTIDTTTNSGGKARRVVAVLFHSVLTSLYDQNSLSMPSPSDRVCMHA